MKAAHKRSTVTLQTGQTPAPASRGGVGGVQEAALIVKGQHPFQGKLGDNSRSKVKGKD